MPERDARTVLGPLQDLLEQSVSLAQVTRLERCKPFALTLDEPGKYTVYYEYQSVLEGKTYSGESRDPGLEYALTNKATGAQIPVRPPSSTETYTYSQRAAFALRVFTVTEPGEYEFSARYPTGVAGQEVVLVIGKGVLAGIFLAIGKAAIVFLGSVLVGVVTIVVVARKRGKARRAAATPYYQPYGTFPGGQPPG